MVFVSSRSGLVRTAVVTFALLLAGCAGNGLLDQLDQTTPVGSDFSKALFKNYSYLAHSFGDEAGQAGTAFDSDNSMSLSSGNTQIADLATAYAQKALDSAQGQEVLPEPAPDGDSDAATVRDRLLKSLEDGRSKFPADAARAQAEYDCWIMDRSVDGLQQAGAQCRRGLDAALSTLEHELNPAPPAPPPASPAADYTVYFDFDSWTLKAEELATLQKAIETARTGGQSRITVVGHTDTSGSAEYNQKLSEKRANVVVEALVDMGARREAIQASGVGENDLAVQTGDGVKEPKNRRSVITLVP